MPFSSPPQLQEEAPVFSVTEFIDYINLAVGRRRVVVEGEVSGFSVNQGKWAFFDLKDVHSKVACFALAYQLGVPLEDGMHVQVTGAPRLYGKSGKFSIMIDHVELKGAGALKRAFELTKAKLQTEGLFDADRKRQLMQYPERIGLVCSQQSAAYTDFMRIVNARWGGLDIHLAHVHVQGESAVKEIVGAFQWFNAHGTELGIETLVLIRGGGSLEDLQAFNSEAVARAVFGSCIPVICGVGHECDESLADYAADVRAATPTHAATLTVPDRTELLDRVLSHVHSLNQCVEHELDWHRGGVERNVLTLQHAVQGMIQQCTHLFGQFAFSLSAFESTLANTLATVTQTASVIIRETEQAVEKHSTSLSALERILQGMNPLAVLKRGYAIVQRKGRAVSSRANLKPGDMINLRFSDGELPATIDSPQGRLL